MSSRCSVLVALALMGPGAAFPSCTVKQDRAECPCKLDLYCSATFSKPVFVDLRGGGKVMTGSISGSGNGLSSSRMMVPRDRLDIISYSGLEKCTLSGKGEVRIPLGEQMDPLYTYRSEVDACGDSASDTLSLHKEYISLQLVFNNLPEGEHGFLATVRGGVAGVDISDGSPIGGPFRFSASPYDGRYCVVRIPRQSGADLTLNITSGEGYDVEYDLGGLMESAGFDWMAEELDDVMLTFDSVETGVQIRIVQWEEQYDEWEI